MKVFKFMSAKNDALWAITPDQTAKNLPADLGPWHALGRLEVNPGEMGHGGASSDEILDAINRRGFFMPAQE
ncbi:MAG: hypothetical protein ACREQI_08970 [Candidatus Binataceae bacterium]